MLVANIEKGKQLYAIIKMGIFHLKSNNIPIIMVLTNKLTGLPAGDEETAIQSPLPH